MSLLATTLLLSVAAANDQRRDWGGRWSGSNNDDGDGAQDYNPDSESDSFGPSSSGEYSAIASNYASKIIARAMLASAVWVLFVPWAALLLRINLKSPVVLKLHAILQILSYLTFVAGVGIGIWLVKDLPADLWGDVHTRLGIAILFTAFFQPILGYIHHHILRSAQRPYEVAFLPSHQDVHWSEGFIYGSVGA